MTEVINQPRVGDHPTLENMRSAPVGTVLTFENDVETWTKSGPDAWIFTVRGRDEDLVRTTTTAWERNISSLTDEWTYTSITEVDENRPVVGQSVRPESIAAAPIGTVARYLHTEQYTKVGDDEWQWARQGRQPERPPASAVEALNGNGFGRTTFDWRWHFVPEPAAVQQLPDVGAVVRRGDLPLVPVGSVATYTSGNETITKTGDDEWTHRGAGDGGTAHSGTNARGTYGFANGNYWTWTSFPEAQPAPDEAAPAEAAHPQPGEDVDLNDRAPLDGAPIGAQIRFNEQLTQTLTKCSETNWRWGNGGGGYPMDELWTSNINHHTAGAWRWVTYPEPTPATLVPVVGANLEHADIQLMIDAPVGSELKFRRRHTAPWAELLRKVGPDRWEHRRLPGEALIRTETSRYFWDANAREANRPHWWWTQVGTEVTVELPVVGSPLPSREDFEAVMRAVPVGAVFEWTNNPQIYYVKTGGEAWVRHHDGDGTTRNHTITTLTNGVSGYPNSYRWRTVGEPLAGLNLPAVGSTLTGDEQLRQVPVGSVFRQDTITYTKTAMPCTWRRRSTAGMEETHENLSFDGGVLTRPGSYTWDTFPAAPAAATVVYPTVGTMVNERTWRDAPLGSVMVYDTVEYKHMPDGWHRFERGIDMGSRPAATLLSRARSSNYRWAEPMPEYAQAAVAPTPEAPVNEPDQVRELMDTIMRIFDADEASRPGADRYAIRVAAERRLGMRVAPAVGATVPWPELRRQVGIICTWTQDGILSGVYNGDQRLWLRPSTRGPRATDTLTVIAVEEAAAQAATPQYANRREFMRAFWEVYDRAARDNGWCDYAVILLRRHGITRTNWPGSENDLPRLAVGDTLEWPSDWDRSLQLPQGSLLHEQDRAEPVVRNRDGWMRTGTNHQMTQQGVGVYGLRVMFIPQPQPQPADEPF